MSESATQASGSRALLAALAGACLLQPLVSRAALSCPLHRAPASRLTCPFAVALVLAAGALVPSELVRILSSRDVRRRVFEPRLARRGVWGGVVREAGLWPLAWAVTAWSIDDTDQEVVDGAPAAAAVARKACAHPLPHAVLLPPELGLDAAVYIGTARLGLRIILATAWWDLVRRSGRTARDRHGPFR